MPVSSLVEPAYRCAPEFTQTLGPEVADLAEMAGFAPDPEQRLALDLIFALHGDKCAAFEACVICSRQNLKTGVFKQATLGWLFITDQRLIVWSAHEFSTAKEALRDLAQLIEGCAYLSRHLKTIRYANDDPSIELMSGQRVKFKARTRSGGRGLSGDKVVLDEAFALTPDHMGALLPTLSVMPDPQVVYGSSAGMAASDVLRGIRDRGRAASSARLAYLEWCARQKCASDKCSHEVDADGCALDDVEAWREANPLLGRTRANGTGLTVEYVKAERQALPPLEFARERLGWWEEGESAESAIDLGLWESLFAEKVPPTSVSYAVATGPDRDWTAVAAAWKAGDVVRVQIQDYKPSTGWVADRVADLRAKHPGSVVVNTAARGLVKDAEEPSQTEQAQAHNALSDAVVARTLRHGNQAELNTAVRGARWRPMGDTRVLDRKGWLDISPLDAAALALHQVMSSPAPVPQIY